MRYSIFALERLSLALGTLALRLAYGAPTKSRDNPPVER